MTGANSPEPSTRARMRYSLLKFQAPRRAEFDGLSISSSSSRSSLSISTTDTLETNVSEEDRYDELEDIRVLRPSMDLQDSWSFRHKEFLRDLDSHLRQEPSVNGLNFMLKLRWIARSNTSWRPSVLIATQSARTKLTLALYLLKGPSILHRLPDLHLDICVVQNRIGLSCRTEMTQAKNVEDSGPRAWVASHTSPNGAAVVIEHKGSGERRYAVAGGLLVVGNKRVMLTALHPFLLESGDEGNEAKPAISTSTHDQGHEIVGAITIYHEEVADGDIRLDCKDDTLDHFVSPADQTQAVRSVPRNCYQSSQGIKHWQGALTSIKNGITQIQSQLERKTKTSSFRGVSTIGPRQLPQNLTHNHTKLAPTNVLHRGLDLDWAALELAEENSNNFPLLLPLNQVGGHVIDDILPSDIDTAVDVILATPDGEISARLLVERVFYHVSGRTLELQVVQLDAPLPRGTSGSWVTYRNKFCGMIVAVSDDIPEAYIVPANVLISDLGRICGAPVSLPDAPYADPALQCTTVHVHDEALRRDTYTDAQNSSVGLSSHPNNISWRENLHSPETFEHLAKRDRQERLSTDESFVWALVQPEMRLWLDGGPRFSWIKGDPGSGKSSVLKSLDFSSWFPYCGHTAPVHAFSELSGHKLPSEAMRKAQRSRGKHSRLLSGCSESRLHACHDDYSFVFDPKEHHQSRWDNRRGSLLVTRPKLPPLADGVGWTPSGRLLAKTIRSQEYEPTDLASSLNFHRPARKVPHQDGEYHSPRSPGSIESHDYDDSCILPVDTDLSSCDESLQSSLIDMIFSEATHSFALKPRPSISGVAVNELRALLHWYDASDIWCPVTTLIKVITWGDYNKFDTITLMERSDAYDARKEPLLPSCPYQPVQAEKLWQRPRSHSTKSHFTTLLKLACHHDRLERLVHLLISHSETSTGFGRPDTTDLGLVPRNQPCVLKRVLARCRNALRVTRFLGGSSHGVQRRKARVQRQD